MSDVIIRCMCGPESHRWKGHLDDCPIGKKREQARKEFDAAAIEMANIMYVKCGEQGCKDMLCKRVEVIRAAAVTLGLLPPTCTCDRTGWHGRASPELHEVNCPARKDGRKS